MSTAQHARSEKKTESSPITELDASINASTNNDLLLAYIINRPLKTTQKNPFPIDIADREKFARPLVNATMKNVRLFDTPDHSSWVAKDPSGVLDSLESLLSSAPPIARHTAYSRLSVASGLFSVSAEIYMEQGMFSEIINFSDYITDYKNTHDIGLPRQPKGTPPFFWSAFEQHPLVRAAFALAFDPKKTWMSKANSVTDMWVLFQQTSDPTLIGGARSIPWFPEVFEEWKLLATSNSRGNVGRLFSSESLRSILACAREWNAKHGCSPSDKPSEWASFPGKSLLETIVSHSASPPFATPPHEFSSGKRGIPIGSSVQNFFLNPYETSNIIDEAANFAHFEFLKKQNTKWTPFFFTDTRKEKLDGRAAKARTLSEKEKNISSWTPNPASLPEDSLLKIALSSNNPSNFPLFVCVKNTTKTICPTNDLSLRFPPLLPPLSSKGFREEIARAANLEKYTAQMPRINHTDSFEDGVFKGADTLSYDGIGDVIMGDGLDDFSSFSQNPTESDSSTDIDIPTEEPSQTQPIMQTPHNTESPFCITEYDESSTPLSPLPTNVDDIVHSLLSLCCSIAPTKPTASGKEVSAIVEKLKIISAEKTLETGSSFQDVAGYLDKIASKLEERSDVTAIVEGRFHEKRDGLSTIVAARYGQVAVLFDEAKRILSENPSDANINAAWLLPQNLGFEKKCSVIGQNYSEFLDKYPQHPLAPQISELGASLKNCSTLLQEANKTLSSVDAHIVKTEEKVHHLRSTLGKAIRLATSSLATYEQPLSPSCRKQPFPSPSNPPTPRSHSFSKN